MDYVIWHAKISIPTLLVIAVTHYFWQKHCDKIEGEEAFISLDEVDLVNQLSREKFLSRMMTAVDTDVIIIDCPPALGLLTVNALTAADGVLIPVQAEYFALEGLGQLLQTIQLVKHNLNSKLEIFGVVLTMFTKRTVLSEQVQKEVSEHFKEKLFKTVVPRNVRLAEAPSFGKTIFEHDRWSKGAKAYKSLAAEIEKRANLK